MEGFLLFIFLFISVFPVCMIVHVVINVCLTILIFDLLGGADQVMQVVARGPQRFGEEA